MALISLGENKWRMVRRALRKKKPFTYTEARNGTRHDKEQFEWLVENGFFMPVGQDRFEVTPKGRDSADLGLYEV